MAAVKSKIKKYVVSALRIAVAAFAMWLVAKGQNWQAIWETFAGLNPFILLLSFLLLIANQTLVATRWHLLLQLQTIDIGLSNAIKLTFVGFFYNNFLPGSVGGDVLRAWYVTRHTPKRLEAVLSVFIDRLIGFLGILIMAMAAYMIFSQADKENVFTLNSSERISSFLKDYKNTILSISFAVAALVIIAFLIRKSRLLMMLAYLHLQKLTRNIFIKISKSLFIYCCRPVSMIVLLGLTFFCQIMFIFGLWLVGKELGITAGFNYYLVCIPLSWALGMLPISIGGVGVMEGGLVFLLMNLAGISSEKAFALALCQRLALLFGSIPGMFIHISGGHVPEEFSIDEEAGIN